MGMDKKHVLFTGPPRCGKSTLIEKIVTDFNGPATGFFTREIRQSGERVGFSINTLNHRTGVLAHQDIRSRFRVGRYGVNLEDIEQIAVPAMIPDRPDTLIVIDEIGKMECFSELFKTTLVRLLDSRHRVLGSITTKGDLFIRQIKSREDVVLAVVTLKNRNELKGKYLSGQLIS
jgi:nucleoside-triphosphatase